VEAMGIQEVLSIPRSPWLRAYVERVVGTMRRECFDHVIVFAETSLYPRAGSAVTRRQRRAMAMMRPPPRPAPMFAILWQLPTRQSACRWLAGPS
jgi:hypothetical protein